MSEDPGAPGACRWPAGVRKAMRVAGSALAVGGVTASLSCSGAEASGGHTAEALDEPGAEMTATTPSGATVRVRFDPARPVVGPVEVSVAVTGSAAASTEALLANAAVDLFAPEMPMHGIVRYPLARASEGVLAGAFEIPMAGRWLVYVTLDGAADAAEFELEVLGEGGAHMNHGGAEAGHSMDEEDPPAQEHPAGHEDSGHGAHDHGPS